jgi:peroxiredoxin
MSKQEASKSRIETGRTVGASAPSSNPANKSANGKSQAQMSARGVTGPGTKKMSGNAIPAPPVGKKTGKMQGQQRAVQAKPKKGFRLRPLDVALVLAGVLVVGFIILSAVQVRPTGLSSGATGNSSGVHVPVGQPAPDFTVQDVAGKDYTLSAYKGSPVVLEFMATWCPHCQENAPVYTNLHDNYASKGVQVWGVNATPVGHDHTSPVTTDDLKWFQDTYKTTYTLLFDKALRSTTDYGINSYPSVYIVGKDGNIAYQPPTDALPTYEQLAAKLDELLK